MTMLDIADWLTSKISGIEVSNSQINKDADTAVAVYDRTVREQPSSVGTRPGYGTKAVAVLVRWSNSASACEKKAQELLEIFRTAGRPVIADTECFFVANRNSIDLGRDEKGIFERTFTVELFHGKD